MGFLPIFRAMGRRNLLILLGFYGYCMFVVHGLYFKDSSSCSFLRIRQVGLTGLGAGNVAKRGRNAFPMTAVGLWWPPMLADSPGFLALLRAR